MKKFLYFILIVCILNILSMPSFSIAENLQIDVQEGEISVETIPNNPQPYGDVTINLTSYATDLNKAIIVWTGDKGVILSGIGETSYSFKAGGPNTSNAFNIKITPVGSMNTISKKIVINPSEIDVVWESVDGYTPPFYKGKALPTSGSTIRVVAIPNTNTIKTGVGSMAYIWSNTSETKLDASGYNKNSYTFKNSMFDDTNEVKVIASSVNGNYGAESTIKIPVYPPKVLFYKKSPTEGVLYNKNLDNNYVFSEEEMTIVAVPYFLATKGVEFNFNYNWDVNGEPIKTPKKKTELTIRPASRGGYADISITIESVSDLFQKVIGQLKLTL
ncbi:MAG: hypothetical protein WCW04_02725 [Candidatus Paceibacterota bacterium]